MRQQTRPTRVSAFGLLLASGVIVASVLVPSEARTDFSTAATEPFLRVAQAEIDLPVGEATSEPPQATPTDPNAAPEAEAAEAADAERAAAEEEEKCCKAGDKTPPFKLIAETPPGELNNPYDWKELAAQNEDDPDYLAKQFRLPGCSECHGPAGGGKFCPTLNKGVWSWGNTDDVLFRLIALGSAELERQGWTRYQQGEIEAPMPEMGQVVKTSDQLWKIISFIRSINPPGAGPPEKVLPGKYTAPVQAVPAE